MSYDALRTSLEEVVGEIEREEQAVVKELEHLLRARKAGGLSAPAVLAAQAAFDADLAALSAPSSLATRCRLGRAGYPGGMRTVAIHVPEEGRSTFDTVELWRKEGGQLSRITGMAPEPAATREKAPLSIVPSRKYAVQGLQLPFLYNGTQFIVSFSGATPLTFAEVAAAINTQAGTLRALVGVAGLRIETITPGALTSLRFPSSDAASILELPQELTLRGKDASPRLRVGQTTYLAADPDEPTDDTRYVYRLISSFNPTVFSEFSSEFLYGAASRTTVMEVTLTRATGEPWRDEEVFLYTDALYSSGEAVAPMTVRLKTNKEGKVSQRIRRGVSGLLVIPVAGWSHHFQAPVDEAIASFNPLDPLYATDDDAFRVVVPTFPTVRSSP